MPLDRELLYGPKDEQIDMFMTKADAEDQCQDSWWSGFSIGTLIGFSITATGLYLLLK